MPALFKIISSFYVFMMNFSDGYRYECRDLLGNNFCDGSDDGGSSEEPGLGKL